VISVSFQIEAARKHKKVPAESLIEQTRAAIGFSSDHKERWLGPVAPLGDALCGASWSFPSPTLREMPS
jgi:hypothetical protein